MTTAGPFGPGAMGVPDLGAIAAQQAAQQMMQESGQVPFTHSVTQLLAGIATELQGIRVALTPADLKNHKPAIAPLTDQDGNDKGWGVYCLACTDIHGEFIYPCQVPQIMAQGEWPPQVLQVDPEYAELLVETASPEVPDFPPDATGQDIE